MSGITTIPEGNVQSGQYIGQLSVIWAENSVKTLFNMIETSVCVCVCVNLYIHLLYTIAIIPLYV